MIAGGTGAIDRYAFDLRPLSPSIKVNGEAREIVPSAGDRATAALIRGERTVLAFVVGDKGLDNPVESSAPGALQTSPQKSVRCSVL